MVTSIVAIMTIPKIIKLTPDPHNYCNYGNSEKKNRRFLMIAIVAIMAIFKKKSVK